MTFIKLGHYRVNLKNVCYYPGGGHVNLIGFGNTVQVPDEVELSTELDKYAKSPKSPIVKVEDGGRKIYLNVDNLQHFRHALKTMNLSFHGHVLQIHDLEAIGKILHLVGEEEAHVGRSSHRNGTE